MINNTYNNRLCNDQQCIENPSPMAVKFFYGLTFATIAAPLVVPLVKSIINAVKPKSNKKALKRRK